MTVHCPYCGSFEYAGGRVPGHMAFTRDGEQVCPTCEMTPGEHAYRLRILADSAAVYAEEHRAFQAQRTAGRRAS